MREFFVVAVALAVVAAGASAASARLPTVLTQDSTRVFVVRPATIGYTGDGTGIIGGRDGTDARHPGRLRWPVYNRRQGVGTGIVWLDDCEPDCADGAFHPYAARVHVFTPKHGHFTRLTVSFTYHGRHVVDRRRAALHGTYWAYEIVSQTGFGS